jgi:hypothetical protein
MRSWASVKSATRDRTAGPAISCEYLDRPYYRLAKQPTMRTALSAQAAGAPAESYFVSVVELVVLAVCRV